MSAALLKDRIDAVVIGASAGGVEALNQMLPALPGTLRPPILVTIHLLRDRPSLLADIFRSKCALKVREPEDKEPIEPGTVYFAPPDYHLLIGKNRRVVLSVDEMVNFSRPSIDVLFESAADVYRERLMGIVLSGANSDGTAGLQSIHRFGGVTVVQQPDEALAKEMVESAIANVAVDCVLPLSGITQLLQSLDGGSSSPIASTTR
jgi:two-component system chemotaxis response regulator CheB